MQGLENSVSRVSRLIWALHLTFNEGISDHFAQILSQQYPGSLLPELQKSCQVFSFSLAVLIHAAFLTTPISSA